MRALFLAMTAIAVAIPATSVQAEPAGFTGISVGGGGHSGFRGDRRGHRGNEGVVFYDNYREYQGDTAWKSDSFNDWWHDRPDRAYPRWMAANKQCERTYWAGGTWRC